MPKRQAGERIRVLVVEDSRAQRELLVALLEESGIFTVVGTASSGPQAVESTVRLRPDIIAMDIHMPGFDGYEATRQIMRQTPTPIVMVSSSIGDAARRSLEAQTVGALAVVRKPGSRFHREYEQDREVLLRTLRLMADVPVVTRHTRRVQPMPAPADGSGQQSSIRNRRFSLLAIASSTGGPAAVQVLLQGLGKDFPLPIMLAQHIARGFVEALVDWLQNTTPFVLRIATSGERMQPGHVYLPPDDQHILVHEQHMVRLRPIADGDRYCPSGDYLFESVARVYGRHALGVILTGMGNDGARGLRVLHERGGHTFAQDEASCVVYGMPQAAVALGAVTRIEPLGNLAQALLQQIGHVAEG
jgi:two-component system chemotaxis response regulator CheB